MALDASPLRTLLPTGSSALRRIGTLAARTWRAKPYAPAAWSRHVLDASPPSPDAYLAECCA